MCTTVRNCGKCELDYLVPGIALARQDTTHIFLDGPVRVVAPSSKIVCLNVRLAWLRPVNSMPLSSSTTERPGIAAGPFFFF